MRDSKKEDNQLKAAIKIIDMTYSIVLNDEKAGNKNDLVGDTEKSKPKVTGKVIQMTVS